MKNKKRPLTIKQRRFIRRTLETGNASEAAMEIYNVKNKPSARAVASSNLQKAAIREEIEKALQAEGATEKEIIAVLHQNMKKGEGVQAKASDSIKAAEILLKLHGYLKKPYQQSQSLTINYSNLSIEELFKQRKKLNEFWNRIIA